MDRKPARLRGLRRRVFVLVYRDAARAHGLGVAALVLPQVYLYREWPPWEIRRAVASLDPWARAAFVVVALVGYVRLLRPVVDTLLASQRLELLRTLPCSRGWWQRTHGLHLLALAVPVLVAIGYAVAPGSRLAAAGGFAAAAGLVLGGQVGQAALADRPRSRAVAAVGVTLVALVAFAVAPVWLAGGLGAVAIVAAAVRLRAPFPRGRARARRRWRSRGPALALARWLAVVLVRRSPALSIWTVAVPLGLQGLVAVGTRNVASLEPTAAASLVRGAAVFGAVIGAAAILHALRRVDRGRAWFDALPISAATETRARLIVGVVATAPTWLLGGTIPCTVGMPAWLGLGPLVVAGWAVVVAADLVARREAGDHLDEATLPRWLATAAIGALVVVFARTTLVLVPWAIVAGVSLHRAMPRARRARRRLETYQRSDDHDDAS